MPVRVGIIGCGAISWYHLAGWRRIPDVSIEALADTRLEQAEARRQEFAPKARIYDSLDALLASEQIDLVDIITPPELHAAHCRRAARAGVHILCQKPLCPALAEARALVGDLRDYPRLFGVHENHPYRGWFRRVHDAVRAGTLGTLRHIALEQHDPFAPPEPFKCEAAHGVLLEYGVHLIAMARTIAGDPAHVAGTCWRVNPHVHGESLAQVTLRYPTLTASIGVSWKSGGAQQGGALFIGDAGEAVYEGRMTRGEDARFRVVRGDQVLVDHRVNPTEAYTEAFHQLEREAIESLLTGRRFGSPAVDHLRTLAVTFAAYESAETGQSIELAPWLAAAATS